MGTEQPLPFAKSEQQSELFHLRTLSNFVSSSHSNFPSIFSPPSHFRSSFHPHITRLDRCQLFLKTKHHQPIPSNKHTTCRLLQCLLTATRTQPPALQTFPVHAIALPLVSWTSTAQKHPHRDPPLQLLPSGQRSPLTTRGL